MLECAYKQNEEMMRKVEEEIMLIAQEECAEVTQAISKVFRFGFSSVHPVTGKSNIESLEEEIGDLECMLELMKSHKLVDANKVAIHKVAKYNKLKTWSNI
jgi:NTP pyrophosphatase (non-canonical NTP hydrolase)